MKAMTLKVPGGLENFVLVDRARPDPKPGEIVMRVHANALNYHDYVIAAGILPVADGRVVMSDGAGEVVAVGAGVTAFAPGDRVVSTFYPAWLSGAGSLETTAAHIPGETHDGYACAYVAVPELWVTKAPSGYSHAEAATLTCAGLTAWRAVAVDAKVKPGDVVLVQGTGGVSLFALQFAKAAGATVIATTSSREKREKLHARGADCIINSRDTPAWGARAKDLTGGRGVDLVVEIAGAATIDQSLAACRFGGHIAVIGVLAGFEAKISLPTVLLNEITIKGLRVGSRADQMDMIRGIEACGIKPVIDSVFPLEAIADAYRHQASQRHFGKICLAL